MEPLRDLAIVLKSIAFEDRHRVVTALTEHHGQISAIARNAVQSKRFGGSLELFVASDWIFSQKPGAHLYQLKEAQVRFPFEGIRKSFEHLSLGSVFSELMLRVTPQNEASPELFKLHSNALLVLNETVPQPRNDLILLNSYLAKLLQWSGIQPQLETCLSCQVPLEAIAAIGSEEIELSCVISNAGWICPQCRALETHHIRERNKASFHSSLLRVTPRSLLDFRRILSFPIRQVQNQVQATLQEHEGLFKYLEALMVYHLPGFDKLPLKSLRFLDLPQQTLAARNY